MTLEQNESTRRLKFTGLIYNLEITSESITLVAADSGAEVALWKYKQIRTYGKASGKFNFECGRTAETGQGNFVFKTTCSKEIFGVVHHNIKRIRAEMDGGSQEAEGNQMHQGGQLTKQASLPSQTQPLTNTTDYRMHQQEPMKPRPYKQKKGAQSMSVGMYRCVCRYSSSCNDDNNHCHYECCLMSKLCRKVVYTLFMNFFIAG